MNKEEFEKSELYKKALKKYQENLYKDILNPLEVIVKNRDEVYLFYEKDKVKEIFKIIVEEYNKQRNYEDGNSIFPVSLGYEEPKIIRYRFMGIEYEAISLWYDNCDVPEIFEK